MSPGALRIPAHLQGQVLSGNNVF